VTWERICLWGLVASFLGVVTSIGYAYFVAPAPWTRMAFAISVLVWIVSAAFVYTINRRKRLDHR
jgi:hypothetical protein